MDVDFFADSVVSFLLYLLAGLLLGIFKRDYWDVPKFQWSGVVIIFLFALSGVMAISVSVGNLEVCFVKE